MNKTMLILSRGSCARTKNILRDLEKLLNSYKENKYDQKNSLIDLKELMEVNDCSSTIYFESTKRINYTWFSTENGPSIRFIAYNLYTIRDLMFDTNCSLDRKHKLVFDQYFYDREELVIVKDLFKKVFTYEIKNESEACVEKGFADFDRMICLFYVDDKIWMRIYVVDNGVVKEIGPRIVLELDKVLEGCFEGKILYKNVRNIRNTWGEEMNPTKENNNKKEVNLKEHADNNEKDNQKIESNLKEKTIKNEKDNQNIEINLEDKTGDGEKNNLTVDPNLENKAINDSTKSKNKPINKKIKTNNEKVNKTNEKEETESKNDEQIKPKKQRNKFKINPVKEIKDYDSNKNESNELLDEVPVTPLIKGKRNSSNTPKNNKKKKL